VSRCTHHWTVTSECPKCLRAELDEARAEVERLRAKAGVAHLLIALKEVQKALRVSDSAAIREADDLIDQMLEEYKP